MKILDKYEKSLREMAELPLNPYRHFYLMKHSIRRRGNILMIQIGPYPIYAPIWQNIALWGIVVGLIYLQFPLWAVIAVPVLVEVNSIYHYLKALRARG